MEERMANHDVIPVRSPPAEDLLEDLLGFVVPAETDEGAAAQALRVGPARLRRLRPPQRRPRPQERHRPLALAQGMQQHSKADQHVGAGGCRRAAGSIVCIHSQRAFQPDPAFLKVAVVIPEPAERPGEANGPGDVTAVGEPAQGCQQIVVLGLQPIEPGRIRSAVR